MVYSNLLKSIHFSLVQDMEQFYELWLKSQKNEKSDDVASQSNKENGKQIHMPTDYAEVTVSPQGSFYLHPSFLLPAAWLPAAHAPPSGGLGPLAYAS